MVRKILTLAGFVEGETFKETRFLKPPKTTYAIYMDSFRRWGSDDLNLITEHNYDIELYSYAPDPGAEKRIEEALDSLGIEFEKQDRYWLNEESLYQTIYSFTFIEK